MDRKSCWQTEIAKPRRAASVGRARGPPAYLRRCEHTIMGGIRMTGAVGHHELVMVGHAVAMLLAACAGPWSRAGKTSFESPVSFHFRQGHSPAAAAADLAEVSCQPRLVAALAGVGGDLQGVTRRCIAAVHHAKPFFGCRQQAAEVHCGSHSAPNTQK